MSTDRRNAHDGDVDSVATAIGLYALGEIGLGKAAEWGRYDLLGG